MPSWQKWLWVGCLVALAVLVGPTHAQTVVTLDSLNIEVWPEFDQPSALVIVDGTLAATVSPSTTIEIRIPAASGGPLAVAEQGVSGQLINTPFSTATVGDAIVVTFQPLSRIFRVEYYDPSLTRNGNDRAFTLKLPIDYAIAEVSARVQQPFDATNLATTPALAAAGVADDGLNYYAGALGAFAPGQTLSLHITYAKPTPTLSLAAIDPSPPTTSAPSPVTPAAEINWAMIALGVVGGALVSGGAIWWFHNTWSGAQSKPKAKRHRPAHATSTPSAPRTPPAAFCTQCGAAAQPADQFCRQCGARRA